MDPIDDQLRYYGDRASTYDDAYARTGTGDGGEEANAAWFAELAVVEAAVDETDVTGDVLELGCGTGHWTQRLASRASSVTALDGAPGMLEVATAKLAAANLTNVELRCVDIIRSWEPDRTWDAAAAFFFLEHVPDDHIDGVVAKLARALRPDGALVVAEGRRREEHAEALEHRHLHDHDHDHDVVYEVVERRRSAEEFVELFGRHGIDVDVTHTDRRFTIVRGRRRSS